MKIFVYAATALALSGAAYAYQTEPMEVDPNSATTSMTTVRDVDPTLALTPPSTWTDQQRTLWEQHLATFPTSWADAERTAFRDMMAIAPANWTDQQRALYAQHIAHFPSSWSEEQRRTYEQQIANLRTPWVSHQTASSSVSPNFQTFAGMGGPYEEVYGSGTVSLAPRPADSNYPPCDPGPGDDNCIQLYERGVRAQLASWNSATGGLADGSATTAMGGPFEPADESADDRNRPVSMTNPGSSTTNQTADPLGSTQDDTTEPTL